MTTPRQRTISREGEARGVGLHTGVDARLRLRAAPVDSGIVFRRTDLEGAGDIVASVANVVETDRGTTLGSGEARVHTVEHLLSAAVGAGIDNLIVELDGPEPPALDGSARPFLDLLLECGVEEQDAPVRIIRISDTFSVQEGESEYVVAPAAGYRLSTTIEFDHPLIGRQFYSARVDPVAYRNDIASARTFGFVHEVEALKSRGLALGGSPGNAVVLTSEGLHEGTELRYPDEFVRHKTLDLVGDLALLGARLQGHVVAHKPSHRGNVELAREIQERAERKALARPILNIQQILQYLPHRYPFLLVDRVVEYEEGKRIVGLKNVTINEPFFPGHFPHRPVFPGVIIFVQS